MKLNNYLIPDWEVPTSIHAAMTLRTGGISQGAYASLNPAIHVNDNNEAVFENRKRIKKDLGLPSEPLWLNQIHSTNIVELGRKTGKTTSITADASFTCDSNVVCCVLTADCLPILFCSQKGEKIAAIHAGWRGLANGIISNTIRALKTTDLTVWFGVAIAQCCFEVGAEVREIFVTKNNAFATAFLEAEKTKYLADIYQLARTELALNGVHQVYGGGLCTVCDTQRFYSYRRDNQTGRMATLIWKD